MSYASKPFSALHRKRLAIALVALPLSALIVGCGNDDAKAPDTGNAGSALNAGDANTNAPRERTTRMATPRSQWAVESGQ